MDVYQSMFVQLTKAGNRRARTRNVEPTGEKHSTIFAIERITEPVAEKREDKYLEISSNFVDEELPTVLFGVFNALSTDFVLDTGENLYCFIIGEQSVDFSRGEEIVDQHQKLLIGHLSVGHQKDRRNVLDARSDVQIIQILEISIG